MLFEFVGGFETVEVVETGFLIEFGGFAVDEHGVGVNAALDGVAAGAAFAFGREGALGEGPLEFLLNFKRRQPEPSQNRRF